jgi:DNA-binding SARP family transcriptional activator
VEFERLARTGEPAQALSLYEGEFLAGFHVPDVSAEHEEWVDRTRARLRRLAATAALAAARAEESQGRTDEAVTLVRRACELEPDQEGGWRRLMALQDRVGDRAGALCTYDELAARLRRDFDADPSAETASLAAQLRAARVPPVAPDTPPLMRLSELYDARGDRSRAQRTRTQLLALWRRADATLQPALADIRGRVTTPDR